MARITIPELVTLTGVNRKTAYGWTQRKDFPKGRIIGGGEVRPRWDWDREAVLRWLETKGLPNESLARAMRETWEARRGHAVDEDFPLAV